MIYKDIELGPAVYMRAWPTADDAAKQHMNQPTKIIELARLLAANGK